MTCYRKGDKVWYVSPVSGIRGKALFVQHDKDGFPKRDAILAIGIGMKGDRMVHTFRWPLRFVERIDNE